MSNVKVVFLPSGRRGEFPQETPVLRAAQLLGVDLDSVCGGRGICGRCQCVPMLGAFPKEQITSSKDALSHRNRVEDRYADKRGMQPDRRLGCQAKLLADSVIHIPPDSQAHRQIISKNSSDRKITLDPAVRLYGIQIEEPDMHVGSSDVQRIREALDQQWGLSDLKIPLAVLIDLQPLLRKADWLVSVAVRNKSDIVAIYPGEVTEVFGAAIDIGSTTVACHLHSMSSGDVLASSGLMNPQIRFGEDLMSRVSYSMLHEGGDAELTKAIRDALGQLISETADAAKVDLRRIVEISVVGNPIMHHVALGLNPNELGMAPFALNISEEYEVNCHELDLELAPGATAVFLPLIAGHVGADTSAMILSEQPYNDNEYTLLVDVGTNAEIVIANRDRMVACSSPTGPAFEGAQISSGQRAAPGAVERVRINPITLEPRYKIIGCDLWSDDEGFAAASSHLSVTGICGSGIIEIVAEMRLSGIITRKGNIRGELQAVSPRIVQDGRTFSYVLSDGDDGSSASEQSNGANFKRPNPRLSVTQNDIRAIQLAKGALYAGCKLLMQRLGLTQIHQVKLAGAFGNHLSPIHCLIVGLVPDCQPERVIAIGNAAGTGAQIALLDSKSRAEIDQVARSIEKIETAVNPDFQQFFVEAMSMPHETDPFTQLRSIVTLPEPTDENSGGDGMKTRRRAKRL